MPRWILQTVFTNMRRLLFTKDNQFILEADKIEMSPKLQRTHKTCGRENKKGDLEQDQQVIEV